MKSSMLLVVLSLMMSAWNANASDRLERKARQMAWDLPAGSDEIILGLKTSEQFFSVSGLLFHEKTLLASDVAVAGKSTFFRAKKGEGRAILTVCGAVLMMTPATREWSVPENLDPSKLLEVVAIDSEGRRLEAQSVHSYSSENRMNQCQVTVF